MIPTLEFANRSFCLMHLLSHFCSCSVISRTSTQAAIMPRVFKTALELYGKYFADIEAVIRPREDTTSG
jgi:hypothetical protein